MRVVLDTNILVRAAGGSQGSAEELLAEPEKVTSYPRVRAATRLNDEKTTEYLAYLKSPTVSAIVSSTAAPRIVPSDPDDDEAVHTAAAGRADWLCTLNRTFTSLLYRAAATSAGSESVPI